MLGETVRAVLHRWNAAGAAGWPGTGRPYGSRRVPLGRQPGDIRNQRNAVSVGLDSSQPAPSQFEEAAEQTRDSESLPAPGGGASRYEQHPLVVGMMPPHSGGEGTALDEDIADRRNLLLPILLYQGKVIDGWRRYQACERHAVVPRFQVWDGPDDQLLGVILALNVQRRHLTSSQRAAIAVNLLPALEEEAAKRKRAGQRGDNPQSFGEARDKHAGEAAERAASITGTNRDYVAKARFLHRADPALFRQVWLGEVNLSQVWLKAKSEQLEQEARDLHTQVSKGELTLARAMELLVKRRETDAADPSGPDLPMASGKPIGTGHANCQDHTPGLFTGAIRGKQAESERWLTLPMAEAAGRRLAQAGGSAEYDRTSQGFVVSRPGCPTISVPARVLWIDEVQYHAWPAELFTT